MNKSTILILAFCAICFCEYQYHNPKNGPKPPSIIEEYNPPTAPASQVHYYRLPNGKLVPATDENEQNINTNQINSAPIPSNDNNSIHHSTDDLINNVNNHAL